MNVRKRHKEDLKLKRLKPHTTPSKFSKLPRYFNYQRHSRNNSVRLTAFRRHQMEQERHGVSDKVRNLAELNMKLEIKDIPSGLLKYDFVNNTPTRLLFIRINILCANCHMEPTRVLISLSVDEDLQIYIHHLEQKMAKSKYVQAHSGFEHVEECITVIESS